MRIIPVIDVMGGMVVRAMAGRRSNYRPLETRLTPSTDPMVVAEALLQLTGSNELYVADLDAITGDGIPTCDPAQFRATVLLDAGLRTVQQLAALKCWPNVRAVVGTETWRIPPDDWPQPFPAILSLDYLEGQLRTGWPLSTVEMDVSVMAVHATSIIVLDVARVGLGQGSGTEQTIRMLRRGCPKAELIAGGGVRNWDDIHRLEEVGADAVLVASALHDGSLFSLG